MSSRYERRLSDLMVSGQETVTHLRVRRLFCRNEHCARTTSAKQVAGLTTKHGRRSIGLSQVLQTNRVGSGRSVQRPAAAAIRAVTGRGVGIMSAAQSALQPFEIVSDLGEFAFPGR
ncbi:hypothetical protein [Lentzea sp. E54]|uniref:hypothetical protein n=1 Tax=Lentzea xerophila TaxID=3435883 RepID=UPI003DA6B7C2